MQALGPLAAAYYGYPSRRLTVIGVTGTDGKTTTATLLHSILQSAGIATGLLTTISALIGDQALDTGLHVTTPTADEVQMCLRADGGRRSDARRGRSDVARAGAGARQRR